MRKAAAQRFGCALSDVTIAEGRLTGPAGKSMKVSELAGLSADGEFANHHHTYAYGAHAGHVAVDARTGHVELIDYVAVEDVGRIMNPLTLKGQVIGAIVQGLGGTFLEDFVYAANGQLLAGSFADYLLPTASDFPTIRAFLMEEQPSPINPLGAKGAGEGGIIPVGGVIANAVASALSLLDVQPRELPLSPSRLWHLVQAARQRASRAAE